MTDGIDFGQNSQAKFSLNSLMTPQIAGSNIAQDFAQATTVVGNIGKYLKQEGDTANQARYFNANIEYQNLQAEQTKELNDVGNDLSQRRQVLDKYNSLYTGLADKYELNDKYRASLGSQTTSHIDTLENQYGALYKAQKQSEAIDNTTYVISNAINTNPEETKLVYAEMKDYLKANTSLSDREIGDALAGSYINAKVSAMSDKADMTLEEARQNKKDIQDVLEGADPRIVGSALYKQGIQGFNSVIESARIQEEDKIKDMVATGTVPFKTMQGIINTARKNGVITTDEQATLYSVQYKRNLLENDAREENAKLLHENRINNDFNYAFKLSGKAPEEAKTYLDNLVSKGELRQDRADYMLRVYTKEDGILKAQEQRAQLKELYGSLKESSSSLGLNMTQAENAIRGTKEDGSLSAEDQSYLKTHQYKIANETTPKLFASTPLVNYPVTNQDEAKKVAGYAISDAFQKGELDRVATLHVNYGVTGQIPEYFTSGLQQPSKYQNLEVVYNKLRQDFPSSYKELVGKDNATKIELIRQQLNLNGGVVTKDIFETADKLAKQEVKLQPKDYDNLYTKATDNGISDVNGFKETVIDYMRLGQPLSKATDRAINELKPNIYSSFNLTGLPITLNSKQKELLDTASRVLWKDTNSAVTGAVYNKGTNSMWLSEKGDMYHTNTGMSFENFLNDLAKRVGKKTPKQTGDTKDIPYDYYFGD